LAFLHATGGLNRQFVSKPTGHQQAPPAVNPSYKLKETQMNKHYTGIAFMFLAVSAGANAANATDSIGIPLSHPVSYSDLDLTRTAGAETLYRRIKSAADAVCSPLDGARITAKVNRIACISGAVERAVKQVNEPLLTRYYFTLNPKSVPGTTLAATR
jgi:UrcA family protein